MKKNIINACSDLGVHVNGSRNAPLILSELFKNDVENVYTIKANHNKKSIDKNDLKKNINELNNFSKDLYKAIINSNNFNITIGGDHSIAIPSGLASIKSNKLGIIWIDSHPDYNTFETTITGNIHGLPLATLNGINGNELTTFHNGNYYNPKNTVIIGARDIDKLENENLNKTGVKIYTTNDLKNKSIKEIVKEAVYIASKNTSGIHISCDIDIIDSNIVKGINIPVDDGINEDEYFEILDNVLEYKDKIKSFDLVEYNPKRDTDGLTKKIALKTLEKIINDI